MDVTGKGNGIVDEAGFGQAPDAPSGNMIGEEDAAAAASTSTLYAQLAKTRREFRHMTASTSVADELPPAAVLHSLYDTDLDTKTQQALNDVPLSRETVYERIATLQSSLRRFRTSLELDAELAGSTESPAQDASQAEEVKRKRAEALGPAAARLLQSKRQRLVSLLRERSTHVIATTDVIDNLASVSDLTAEDGNQELRHLPECLCICALSPASATIANLQYSIWPTKDAVHAKNGLKMLVSSLEQVSTSDLGLEAFSEEHTTPNSDTQTFTLALAAKIFVIDLELSLQARDQQSVISDTSTRFWHPQVKTRMSYATDGSSEAEKSAVRDGKLADLIRNATQRLASAIFGVTADEGRALSYEDAFREATLSLKVLLRSISILSRLDHLSSNESLVGHPDLFSALESVSKTLARSHEANKSSEVVLGPVQMHCEVPYFSCTYYSQVWGGGSDAREDPESAKAFPKDFKLRIDLCHWSSAPLRQEMSDLAPLSDESSSSQHGCLQYTALLSPALAMPASAGRTLMSACGLPVDASEDLSSSRSTRIMGLAKLVHRRIFSGELAEKQSDEESRLDSDEGAVLVSRLPFSSSAQLTAAVQILRPHAQMNSLLRLCPFNRIKEIFGQDETLTAVLSTDAVSREKDVTSATASFKLTLTTGTWTVNAKITTDHSPPLQLDRGTAESMSQQLNEVGVHCVVQLLDRLETWASSMAASESLTAKQASQDGNAHASRGLKRRRSSDRSSQAIE